MFWKILLIIVGVLVLLFIGLVVYLCVGLSVMLGGDDDEGIRYMYHEGDIYPRL